MTIFQIIRLDIINNWKKTEQNKIKQKTLEIPLGTNMITLFSCVLEAEHNYCLVFFF